MQGHKDVAGAYENCNKVRYSIVIRRIERPEFSNLAIMAVMAILAIFHQLGLQFQYGKVVRAF
jgi:hypothetical protein